MHRTLCLILVWLLLGSGCRSGPDSPEYTATPEAGPSEIPADSAEEDEPAVHLRKTTIKTRQGQKWELEAGAMDWSEEGNRAKATDVNWWLIDENGQRWVEVQSPAADIDMDHEIVTFQGETVATRLGFPETLEVQHLVYKGKDRKFYGSGGVIWKRANVELSGETLTATSQLDKVQLRGNVRGKSIGGFEWHDD
ncbi:MAG: LPS export ABC transporter periplasmic protein LptC [Vulcanimicrobiota bacterium]